MGEVAAEGASLSTLAQDLKLTYTVAGQSGVYEAMLVVPEPATLGLLLSGLLVLAVFHLRQRTPYHHHSMLLYTRQPVR